MVRVYNSFSPWPAWLSAPTTLPKPPSKFLHRSKYPTVLSLSSSPNRPSKDKALTAQYRNRVSTSPKESPAKTPEGCCRESMTRSDKVSHGMSRWTRILAHLTTRSTSKRSRAFCITRIWIALSVERRCASCSGWAPKAPVVIF